VHKYELVQKLKKIELEWRSPSASCHERCSTPALRSDHRHEMALTSSQCKASRAPLFVTPTSVSHALPVVLLCLQASGIRSFTWRHLAIASELEGVP
jgi:hypothetical protein